MPASVQSPPTLRQFGKYILDEEIARGGMARVYLARLRGLGGFEKKLVVKQVLPELASDPRFVEMFVEEAKTLVQMSHPHIVPVYELGVVDGVYFLAMEFVDGATLAEMLREGPLAPNLVTHIGIEICDALSYAHERFELVHRDVTPRNVIVDALGHVRLLDFGIAAKAEGSLEGEVFGSHGYMSPEQARGAIVDPKSDLFSLGTVLYEGASNQPAFLKRTPEQTKTALLEGAAPSLSGHDAIPEELATVIDECLAKSPDDRPASARAIGKRLRGLLAVGAPEGVAPELGDRAGSATELRKKRPSRRPPSATDPTSPDGSVRTIATSVTLRKILGGADTDPDDELGTVPVVDESMVTDPHVDEDAMTGRIEGDEDTRQDRTMPIPGRTASRDGIPVSAAVDSLASTDPREAEAPAGEEASDGRRLAIWVAVIGIAIAGVFGLRAWSEAGTETVPAAHGSDGEAGEGLEPATAGEGSAPTASTSPSEPPVETETGPSEPPVETETGPSEPPVETETEAAVPTAAPASLTISAQPWGNYFLDNRQITGRRIRNQRIPAGSHTLRIENPTLPNAAEPVRFDAPPGAAITATVNFHDADPEIRVVVTPR